MQRLRGLFAHAGTRTPIAPSLCGCGLEAARGEASQRGRGGRREAEAIASRGSRRLDVVRGRRGGADRFQSPLRSPFHTQLFPRQPPPRTKEAGTSPQPSRRLCQPLPWSRGGISGRPASELPAGSDWLGRTGAPRASGLLSGRLHLSLPAGCHEDGFL